MRSALWAALLPLARPRMVFARNSSDALMYLTPSERDYIRRIAREVIPAAPVLEGRVDVALNLDRFLARTRAEDLTNMLHYLRLIRMAEPLIPVIRPFMPGIEQDIMSLKKVVCFVGYYSDANGEADLPPPERVIWPSIGFSGPKPDDWWPESSEPEVDGSALEDRMGRLT